MRRRLRSLSSGSGGRRDSTGSSLGPTEVMYSSVLETGVTVETPVVKTGVQRIRSSAEPRNRPLTPQPTGRRGRQIGSDLTRGGTSLSQTTGGEERPSPVEGRDAGDLSERARVVRPGTPSTRGDSGRVPTVKPTT